MKSLVPVCLLVGLASAGNSIQPSFLGDIRDQVIHAAGYDPRDEQIHTGDWDSRLPENQNDRDVRDPIVTNEDYDPRSGVHREVMDPRVYDFARRGVDGPDDPRDEAIHEVGYDPRNPENHEVGYDPRDGQSYDADYDPRDGQSYDADYDPRDPVSHDTSYDPRDEDIHAEGYDPRFGQGYTAGYDPREYYTRFNIRLQNLKARFGGHYSKYHQTGATCVAGDIGQGVFFEGMTVQDCGQACDETKDCSAFQYCGNEDGCYNHQFATCFLKTYECVEPETTIKSCDNGWCVYAAFDEFHNVLARNDPRDATIQAPGYDPRLDNNGDSRDAETHAEGRDPRDAATHAVGYDPRDADTHTEGRDPRSDEHRAIYDGVDSDPRDAATHAAGYDPRPTHPTNYDPRDAATHATNYDPRIMNQFVATNEAPYLRAEGIPDRLDPYPAAPDNRDPAIHNVNYDPRPAVVDRRSFEHNDYSYDPRPEWVDRRSPEHTTYHTPTAFGNYVDPRPAPVDYRPPVVDRRRPYNPPAREVKDYRRPIGTDPRRNVGSDPRRPFIPNYPELQ